MIHKINYLIICLKTCALKVSLNTRVKKDSAFGPEGWNSSEFERSADLQCNYDRNRSCTYITQEKD
jgi:hypothetical protein